MAGEFSEPPRFSAWAITSILPSGSLHAGVWSGAYLPEAAIGAEISAQWLGSAFLYRDRIKSLEDGV